MVNEMPKGDREMAGKCHDRQRVRKSVSLDEPLRVKICQPQPWSIVASAIAILMFISACGKEPNIPQMELRDYPRTIQAQETVYSLQGDTLVIMNILISSDFGMRHEIRGAHSDTLTIALEREGERISWTTADNVPTAIHVDSPLSTIIRHNMEPFLAVSRLLASGEVNVQHHGTVILDGDSVNLYSIAFDSRVNDSPNRPVSVEAWISASGRLYKEVSTTHSHRVVLYPIAYDQPISDSAFLLPVNVSR